MLSLKMLLLGKIDIYIDPQQSYPYITLTYSIEGLCRFSLSIQKKHIASRKMDRNL